MRALTDNLGGISAQPLKFLWKQNPALIILSQQLFLQFYSLAIGKAQLHLQAMLNCIWAHSYSGFTEFAQTELHWNTISKFMILQLAAKTHTDWISQI